MEHCEKYEALISAAVDGELTQTERSELMAHLAQCPACREVYGELMAMHAAFGDLDADVPGDLTQDVMAKVRAQRQIKKPRHAWWQAAVAAACLALIFVGYQNLRPSQLTGASDMAAFSAAPAGAEGQAVIPPEETENRLENGLAQEDSALTGYAPDAILQGASAKEERTADQEIMDDVLTYFRGGVSRAAAAAAQSEADTQSSPDAVPCPTLSSSAPELEEWIAENIPAEGYSTEDAGAEAWLITLPEYEALTEYLDQAGVPYSLDGEEAMAEESVVCVVCLAPEGGSTAS